MFGLSVNLEEINTITIILRIILAVIIGGIIGIEREVKNQPAGFRTYSLVCLGATIVMMTNQYIANEFGNVDPSRMGAQVISGIGFLGAGTIMVTAHNQVRGLTTAAGLWAAACTGLAIGIGFYVGALCMGTSILMIMSLLSKIDKIIMKRSKVLHLYVIFESTDSFSNFTNLCKENEIVIEDVNISRNKKNRSTNVVALFELKSKKRQDHVELIQQFNKACSLKHIEELR